MRDASASGKKYARQQKLSISRQTAAGPAGRHEEEWLFCCTPAVLVRAFTHVNVAQEAKVSLCHHLIN